jgi:hypothetical protein
MAGPGDSAHQSVGTTPGIELGLRRVGGKTRPAGSWLHVPLVSATIGKSGIRSPGGVTDEASAPV